VFPSHVALTQPTVPGPDGQAAEVIRGGRATREVHMSKNTGSKRRKWSWRLDLLSFLARLVIDVTIELLRDKSGWPWNLH
jgi:hypothetical protein